MRDQFVPTTARAKTWSSQDVARTNWYDCKPPCVVLLGLGSDFRVLSTAALEGCLIQQGGEKSNEPKEMNLLDDFSTRQDLDVPWTEQQLEDHLQEAFPGHKQMDSSAGTSVDGFSNEDIRSLAHSAQTADTAQSLQDQFPDFVKNDEPLDGLQQTSLTDLMQSEL